jgi:YVTN family beta-propeller protein
LPTTENGVGNGGWLVAVNAMLGIMMFRRLHHLTPVALLAFSVVGYVGAARGAESPACRGGPWGPSAIAVAPDGETLYVACADARQLLWVNVGDGQITTRLALPAPPTGVVLDPGRRRLYVTCAAPRSEVVIADVVSGQRLGTISAGYAAMSPVLAAQQNRLYVCNRLDHDVSVIDLTQGAEVARVPVMREPVAAAMTHDERLLAVANLLPREPADGLLVRGAVTLIDTSAVSRTSATPASKTRVAGAERSGAPGAAAGESPQGNGTRGYPATTVHLPDGATNLRGLCISPDDRYAVVTHVLANFDLVASHVDEGWMNTNSVSVIDLKEAKWVGNALLDDQHLGAANPWGVAFTPDGRRLIVAHAGTHQLSVFPAASLYADLRWGFAFRGPMSGVNYAMESRQRIALPGVGPRALAVHGSRVFVAEYFSDSLAVVDLASDCEKRPASPLTFPPGDSRAASSGAHLRSAAATQAAESNAMDELEPVVRLQPEVNASLVRRGEMLFHDARLCFQQWQSCASCHPDGRTDGLNWDLLNDGAGNRKNTKSLLLAHRTPPSMARGVRASAEAAVRAGMHHILFGEPDEEAAVAIDAYLKSLAAAPSPHSRRGELRDAAERGKRLFGEAALGCARCHPAPLYTDCQMHALGPPDVDGRREYDTPTLVECWRTAPYRHDGRYVTVRDLLVEGRHGLSPRQLEALSAQDIDDLVAFVLSL